MRNYLHRMIDPLVIPLRGINTMPKLISPQNTIGTLFLKEEGLGLNNIAKQIIVNSSPNLPPFAGGLSRLEFIKSQKENRCSSKN